MFTIWNWDRRIGTLHFIEAFTKFHRISSNHISSEFHRNFIGISSNFIELHRTSSLHRNFIESVRGSSRVFHVFIELHRKVLQKVSGVHRTGFLFIESVRGSSKCSSTGIFHRNVHRNCQGFIEMFIESVFCSSKYSLVALFHRNILYFIEISSKLHRKCQGFIAFIGRFHRVHRVHRNVFSSCSSHFIGFFLTQLHRQRQGFGTQLHRLHRNFIKTAAGVHRTLLTTPV